MQDSDEIIWGKNDPTASIEQGWALYDLVAKHRADAKFHIINQAGHFSYREHPKEFNELIYAFVQTCEGGSYAA